MPPNSAERFLSSIWEGLHGPNPATSRVSFAGSGALPSVFAVAEFAAAAMGAAGLAIGELLSANDGRCTPVSVDRRLASLWYGSSIQPIGWSLPAPWDPIAGDYEATDGWVRLHTNAPHHRAAALRVLGVTPDREAVARSVGKWGAVALQDAVVDAGGCAAAMCSLQEWRDHPQGASAMAEPLVHFHRHTDESASLWRPDSFRPLTSLRVLDMTRVLAGPVATRFLAAFGAEVLRLDPPGWDEPAVVPDVTVGKRCARLDLRGHADRAVFERLLREADVLIHGYRADALDAIGFDSKRRRELRPGLIDVCLNAYGWSGPWRNRRGFDSLVQMSSGIADEGMRRLGRPRPTPLPVQALDHATGYLMAAAAVRCLTERLTTSCGYEARLSLTRTAALLIDGPRSDGVGDAVSVRESDWGTETELTAWGPARRLCGPVMVGEAGMHWERPATRLGSVPAAW
jgi:CoA-transferase family III